MKYLVIQRFYKFFLWKATCGLAGFFFSFPDQYPIPGWKAQKKGCAQLDQAAQWNSSFLPVLCGDGTLQFESWLPYIC